jgi:tRNA (guanine-N7-)-methyltransferase
VGELFKEDSLSGLYTNHPDPWQKKRQAKKRLLNRGFCEWVAKALKKGCTWRIKTDFEQHILAVIEHCQDLPLDITGRENDVNQNGAPWKLDIVTNYQSKFIEKGLPVYALELTRS